MALSTDTPREAISKISMGDQVVNAAVVYGGAFVAMGMQGHGTSANRGRLYGYNDEAGALPLGFSMGYVATGATSTNPPPETEVDLLGGRYYVGVTGAAGDRTDVGKLVYASDDGTFTLTRPTVGHALGMVLKTRGTASYAEVFFFSAETLIVLGLSGLGQALIHLGHFDFNTIADGNIRTGIPMVNHGKILTFFAMIDVDLTATGDSTALNLEIGAVNVTGGVLTLTGATHVKAAKVDATAITALNEFHEGDALDIEASSTVDGTGGSFDLFITVGYEPGS